MGACRVLINRSAYRSNTGDCIATQPDYRHDRRMMGHVKVESESSRGMNSKEVRMVYAANRNPTGRDGIVSGYSNRWTAHVPMVGKRTSRL